MSYLFPVLDFTLSPGVWFLVIVVLGVQIVLSTRANPFWGLVLPLVATALGGLRYAVAVQAPRGEINGYVSLATYLAIAVLLLVVWGICRCLVGNKLNTKRSAQQAVRQMAKEDAAARAREIIAAREAAASAAKEANAAQEAAKKRPRLKSKILQQQAAETSQTKPATSPYHRAGAKDRQAATKKGVAGKKKATAQEKSPEIGQTIVLQKAAVEEQAAAIEKTMIAQDAAKKGQASTDDGAWGNAHFWEK